MINRERKIGVIIYNAILENMKKRSICPWCNSNLSETFHLISNVDGEAKRCLNCGCIYSTVTIDNNEERDYWETYESKVHNSDVDLYEKRKKAYRVDYEIIKPFLKKKSSILDVGCSDGSFLDNFSSDGHMCEGVEYGVEAYKKSSEKYTTYFGAFPNIEIEKKYDLIIFRGVIQYFDHAKDYLYKAVSLLNEDGMIYITSSPNSECLVYKLYKSNWRLSVNPVAHTMYNKSMLTKWFESNGCQRVLSKDVYLETPYASYINDVKEIAEAIDFWEKGIEIQSFPPAFFDNMLTMVFKKVTG